MKKISSDLFDEALEIAQMANSDTISFSEATSIMNETYSEIYQKCINNSSKDFIKEVYIAGSGKFELPEDFFELESCDGEYYLENNYIITRNSTKMRYFPAPTYISFPAKQRLLETHFNNVIAGYGTRIAYTETEEDTTYYFIYNLETEEVEVKMAVQENDKELAIGKDYFVILSETAISYFDFTGADIASKEASDTSTLVFNKGNISLANDYFTIKYFDYKYVNGGIYKNDDLIFEVEDFENGCFGTFNSHIAFTFYNGQTVNTIDLETMEYIEGDEEYENAIVLKMDNKTGYGVFVTNGNNNYLVSWVPNTFLNFPNNVFYSVIIYKMAEQFKIKNGEDVTQFSALVAQKESQFYDMIRKDIHRNYVIRDVYERRRYF